MSSVNPIETVEHDWPVTCAANAPFAFDSTHIGTPKMSEVIGRVGRLDNLCGSGTKGTGTRIVGMSDTRWGIVGTM